MASGTVTSFTTETELDAASSQIGSEKDAFFTTEARATSKTVPLNSSHVMPEIDNETTTMGVRVGLGEGTGVGKTVDGIGLGEAVGAPVGCAVGFDVGKADGGGGIDGEVEGAPPPLPSMLPLPPPHSQHISFDVKSESS
jgi:hypothetical protein